MTTFDARPLPTSMVLGAAALIGGVAGGRIGMWVASILVGPVDTDDASNLFGTALLLLGPLIAIGLGAAVGYLTGSAVMPIALMFFFRWENKGQTAAYLVLLDIALVPLAIWIMVTVGNESDASGSVTLWVAAATIGGVVPAAARWLAQKDPLRASRAPTGERCADPVPAEVHRDSGARSAACAAARRAMGRRGGLQET